MTGDSITDVGPLVPLTELANLFVTMNTADCVNQAANLRVIESHGTQVVTNCP